MSSPMLEMNNKLKIPQMGFGVFLIKDNAEAEKYCLEAFKLGYRHIDTAHIYGNEKGVGEAIKKSGLKREEIFLPQNYGKTNVERVLLPKLLIEC